MRPKTCRCKPNTVDPSQDFLARGKIHVFIVLNMRDYVEGLGKMDFERIRGGEAFASVMRELAPSANFREATEERETTHRGHDFQVFRGHLTHDWLFPTFHLQKDTVKPPADVAPEDWDNHDFHVRLSRAGFIEVRITRKLPVAGENFVDILHSQLELAARGVSPENRRSLQVKLAMHCANLFVGALPEQIVVPETHSKEHVTFSFRQLDPESEVPYRQRYMTMVFRNIICHRCKKRIEADVLRNQYSPTLAAILEGVLVEDGKGRLTLPEMDEDSTEIKDLASWRDDMCIFAPERALIYFPEKRIYLFGQTGKNTVDYERYWECIARGIEHTVTVRAAMQIIEYETTNHLDGVPALTKKVVDGWVTAAEKAEISQMSQEVANTFNLLPLLRDVLVPTSSFRASYAIKKFEHLNNVLNIRDIEQHVDHNVDELVTFVQFFASMELEDKLNKLGLVLGAVALVVAGPSFLADYSAFFIVELGWPAWTEWLVLGVIVFLAATLILSLLAPGWFQRLTYFLLRKNNPALLSPAHNEKL